MPTPKEDIAAFMRGEFQLGGLAKPFGWYGVAWQEGAFEIHCQATEAFTTGQMPVIHGGAIATLLDNAMGWATFTVLADDETFATADLQVQFVRGAPVGLLKARGTVARRTRALAFCESEVRDEGVSSWPEGPQRARSSSGTTPDDLPSGRVVRGVPRHDRGQEVVQAKRQLGKKALREFGLRGNLARIRGADLGAN